MDRTTLIKTAIAIVVWNALLTTRIFMMATEREKDKLSFLGWVRVPFVLAAIGVFLQVFLGGESALIMAGAFAGFEYIGIEAGWVAFCSAIMLAVIIPVSVALYKERDSDMPGWVVGLMLGLPSVAGIAVALILILATRDPSQDTVVDVLAQKFVIWNAIIGAFTVPVYILIGAAAMEQAKAKNHGSLPPVQS